MSGSPDLRAALVALLVCAGCTPVVAPVAPQEGAPTLALVVTNRTNSAQQIGYEYEAENGGGGGLGEVVPCGGSLLLFGGVAGSYSVTVDGEEVASGQVPPDARADFYLVYRVEIDQEGSATAVGPNLVRQPPPEPAPNLGTCE